MKNLSANLRHRIKILENLVADDLSDNWHVTLELFTNIKQINPQSLKFFEKINFGNFVEASYTLFTIRFNPLINKNMKILFKNKEFLIKKIVNVDEKDKVLQIIALEVI